MAVEHSGGHVQRVTVSVDRRIGGAARDDIVATLRLVLSTVGFAWEEVDPDASPPADLAVAVRPGSRGRVTVPVDLDRWTSPGSWRLAGVADVGGWTVPWYEGEDRPTRVVVCDGSQAVVARDVLFDVFWQATGQDEQHADRNQHGHVIWRPEREADGAARRVPVASALITRLGDVLAAATGITPTPKWPGGARAAACLTHDVDYPEVIRWLEPARMMARFGPRGLGPALQVLRGTRTHWHFSSWMNLECTHGVLSAFYFVPRQGSLVEYARGTPDSFYDVTAPGFRALLRHLDTEGWEVGIHASYRAYESRDRFRAEKERLEVDGGVHVVGCRHHYWHTNPTDPEETLAIHQDIGLEYDSSLAHDRYLGWRRGLCTPYQPYDARRHRQLTLVELPPAWMDDHLFGHQRLNPGDPHDLLDGLLGTTIEHGGCLTVDVHEYVFDDVLFPGRRRLYEWLVRRLVDRGDVWVALPREVARHWRDRSDHLARQSVGL